MWFKQCLVYVIFVVFCFNPLMFKVQSYNILGIFPHAGKSHFDVFEPLMLKLSQIGHNVTVISRFPRETNTHTYHDIGLDGITPVLFNSIDMAFLVNRTRLFKYLGAMPLIHFAEESCSYLGSQKIQNLVKSEANFDLVIIEMFTTDCYLSLVHKFNAPFIGVSSSVIMPWVNDRFANSDNPSYIPVNFMDFSDEMNFLERLENSLVLVLNKIIHKFTFERAGLEAARMYISKSTPALNDIARNASLLLVNSHFSLNRPRPFAPNVIEVGGMHLGKPKSLPKKLEQYIKGSPNGVIYFSMGSMIKAHTFPEEKRRAFLGAFVKLKQRVLWKWENESMADKPDNVMIQPWMPQHDILCHPNVVAFISHGGLLGSTEAVNCGVPMVLMPQYGDQFTNAKALEANGGGVILNTADITEESVLHALNTVLQPSFNKRAKELSAIFRDRPLPPMDTAIYWIEYVARHGGAAHMRTAAVNMPLYKYLLLDVVAFLLLVLIVIFAILYASFKFIFKLICKSNKDKVKLN